MIRPFFVREQSHMLSCELVADHSLKEISMIVELDLTLEKYDLPEVDADEFNGSIKSDKTETVRDCVYGDYRHLNYLSYLQSCWSALWCNCFTRYYMAVDIK